MSSELTKEIREWLRENLTIVVENCDRWGPGNDVHVGLQFKDEHDPFSYARITIPVK